MNEKNNLTKLQMQLCQLKLEERRLCLEMKSLITKNKTIDFFAAKKISNNRNGLKNEIASVEASIIPNIIA